MKVEYIIQSCKEPGYGSSPTWESIFELEFDVVSDFSAYINITETECQHITKHKK